MPSAILPTSRADTYALKQTTPTANYYYSAGSLSMDPYHVSSGIPSVTPIEHLPTELLLYIFDLALPTISDLNLDSPSTEESRLLFSALTLSAVSSHWRTIVSTHPPLWTHTNLGAKFIYTNPVALSHFIQHAHGHNNFAIKINAGAEDLDDLATMGVLLAMGKLDAIHVSFGNTIPHDGTATRFAIAPEILQAAGHLVTPEAHGDPRPLLIKILPANVPSLHRLTLDARPSLTSNLDSSSLEISPPDWARWCVDLISSCTHLQSLRLRGATLLHFCIADILRLPPTLRILHLDTVHDLAELALALRQTPALQEFRCGDIDLGPVSENVILPAGASDVSDPTVLASLKTLVLDSEQGVLPAHIAFYTFFRAPHLTSLNLTSPHSEPRLTGADTNSIFMRRLFDMLATESLEEVMLDIAQEGQGEEDVLACLGHEKVRGTLKRLGMVCSTRMDPVEMDDEDVSMYGVDEVLGQLFFQHLLSPTRISSTANARGGSALSLPKLTKLRLHHCFASSEPPFELLKRLVCARHGFESWDGENVIARPFCIDAMEKEWMVQDRAGCGECKSGFMCAVGW